MKMWPTEQMDITLLRGSMRVMLDASHARYEGELLNLPSATTHKSNMLASEAASATWGTPHSRLWGVEQVTSRLPVRSVLFEQRGGGYSSG
jgi:hypothetical protein